MTKSVDRRSFLRIAGTSIGAGALFTVAPLLGARGAAGAVAEELRRNNGEKLKPFTFVQLSDTHVGFSGVPDPLGTQAFERAVDMINGLRQQPDFVLFTGDLTQDSEEAGENLRRMRQFKEIAGRLKAGVIHCIPGEHDAGPDGGDLFREEIGPTHYSFDHAGVHFIGIDNVSLPKPEIGAEQIAWLKKDVSRFPPTAPIVVFTHRPLFDLKPEWGWFTRDGDEVMNVLSPYENVTVLYGHIHREHDHVAGNVHHHAARSLIFGFPDPATTGEKKPLPFDKDQPFRNLGMRVVQEPGAGEALAEGPKIDDIELTIREYSGTVGIDQILKKGEM